jgi:hypothetical protein
MLKQEELAFVKVISTLELSPALLRELRKARMARKSKKKPLTPRWTKTSSVAPTERRSTALGTNRRSSLREKERRRAYEG